MKDPYGRKVPNPAHGSRNLSQKTASTKMIVAAALELFDKIADPALLVRKLNITAAHVVEKSRADADCEFEQLDLFTNYAAVQEQQEREAADLERERKVQRTVLDIKKRFGKNAILKGMNFQEGATAKDRNRQIGGHKA